MTERTSFYVVAAERSGDLLGAALIRSLRTRLGGAADFSGVGGQAMAEEGVDSPFEIAELSIFGWIDGLKAFRRVKARVAETVDDILRVRPQAVILIDSWGFTLRVAQGVRAADPSIKLIKYVGPQVFATRPGRARTLAATVDRLLTILSFDAPYYEAHGLPVTFVGNPTLERLDAGNGTAFRTRHNIAEGAESLALLFGSRASEIKRLYEPFADAIARLRHARPDLHVTIVLASTVEAMLLARLRKDERLRDVLTVEEDEKADAFAAADVALACSGTVVTELATAGVPTITGYRVGWIMWAIARGFNLIKSRFFSLVNIAADEELVGEYPQLRCTGKQLSDGVSALLDAPERRAELRQRLVVVTDKMRGAGEASERAAAAVLETLTE
jgi:lipid-A-disaccharide synthase